MSLQPPNLNGIADLLDRAVAEDLGAGDVTTSALVKPEIRAEGSLIAKQDGVVAGLPLVDFLLERNSRETVFEAHCRDGTAVVQGETLAVLSGPAQDILKLERLLLNFLQRISGIATLTRRFVEAARPAEVAVLDTRKTTPLWRELEKYAVRAGGGFNHRMGLFDQFLIKDNHLALLADDASSSAGPLAPSGAIAEAVRRCRQADAQLPVEVEVDSPEHVREACEAGADIVLLDNMSTDQLAASVGIVRQWREGSGSRKPLTEASGGIGLDNIGRIAATGVDRISVGALTHSAPALDISLELKRV